MDLEDWELVSNDKFLQIHGDGEEQTEAEFVDMTVKSSVLTSNKAIGPQIEGFQFEEKRKVELETEINSNNSMEFDLDMGESGEGGLDLLKFGTGIGAICSFGITAATICIVLFSSHRKRNNKHHKLQFQIFSNDKRVQCEQAK